MKSIKYPVLYQVNTRVWLTELSTKLGRKATLDDFPDSELDKIAEMGFNWVWLLSVWQTGEVGKLISRNYPGWQKDFRETLPDINEEDIAGSGFAITSYTVHSSLGGREALARLRKRLDKRGIKLMLDFVPNHTGIDHEWVDRHPDYFILGDEVLLNNEPENYFKRKLPTGEFIFAYGRDPYFSGWPDTLQLNYANGKLQEALVRELLEIASQCDGIRCDMAMLVLPEVFEKTWGRIIVPFWPEAIKRVKNQNSGFCFMAEVYWDMEWILQQQGFDYTYDKRLYDRLIEGVAFPIREHFYADIDFQTRMVRFLENHDEQRAAKEFFEEKHKAAAILTYLSPGLRFFHQGQFEGKLKRISPHLVRGPLEPENDSLKNFYTKLLEVLKNSVFGTGKWQLAIITPINGENSTDRNFIAFTWQGDNTGLFLVIVNYSDVRSQCNVYFPLGTIDNGDCRLQDLMSNTEYIRMGSDLNQYGLYLDEPRWAYYVFKVEKL